MSGAWKQILLLAVIASITPGIAGAYILLTSERVTGWLRRISGRS